MAGLFDALSTTYDGVGVDFFAPIGASLLRALPPRSGERWLDVGCGRGAVLLPAAAAIGPAGRAVGIDISAAMVASTLERAAAAGLGNVEARVDDAQTSALEPASFDTLSSSLVLFFLADPAAALAGWSRLLVPGGRLGVTTFGPTDPRWQEVDDVFAPYLPPGMVDARTTGAVGPFGSDDGMADLVRGAGFVDVATVTDAIDVRFADADQWNAFTWSVGQRQMWLSVPEAERPAVRAEAGLRLARHAAPDGSITLSRSVRHTLALTPG